MRVVRTFIQLKIQKELLMETNFIVKVFSPVSGELGCEKYFKNLIEAIEYKISEAHYGHVAKIYHLVEFQEVS